MEPSTSVSGPSVKFQEEAPLNSRSPSITSNGRQPSHHDLSPDKESLPGMRQHQYPLEHSIYSESVGTYEPTLFRGGHNSTTWHSGGRATPGPQRFQYQPSTVDTSSYLTGTDGLQRSYHPGHSYVAVNPFLMSVAQNFGFTVPNIEHNASGNFSNLRPPTPVIPHSISQPFSVSPTAAQFFFAFLSDTLPRQMYLHLQLRLPALYFSRVARVFEDAELSMPDIRRMAVSATNQWKEKSSSIVNSNWDFEPSIISPPFSNLKTSWEGFIDSLMREWKTLNIVSVLLLSAILTMLQIEAAAADPITRYFALASLVCALMSLLYGCMFIIRFGTMRKAYKAAEWAEEAQKTRTSIWWNVWVLLSLPSVWLSWAIIYYVACIMSFVWRTGTTSDPIITLTFGMALAPRLVITGILSLGITYFLLIVSTFWKYEDDEARKQRLLHWAETASTTYRPPSSYRRGDSIGGSTRVSLSSIHTSLPQSSAEPEILEQSMATSPLAVPLDPVFSMPTPASFSRPPPNPTTYTPSFKTVKIMDLRFHVLVSNEMPPVLLQRDIILTDWHTFISDGALTWDNEEERRSTVGRSRPQDAMAHFIERWNVQFFRPRHVQAVLCQELSVDFPASPMFAIYLVDLGPHTALVHGDVAEEEDAGVISRFGSVPTGLERIDVFDPFDPDNHGMKPMGKTVILTGPHVARVHWGGGATFHRGSAIPPTQLGQTSHLHSDAATTASQSSSGGSLASEHMQQMVHMRIDEEPGATLEAT